MRTGKPRAARAEEGTVTVFVVVVMAALLLFAGLVLDGGLALAGHVRALGEAQEAARAGAQQLDLVAYRARGDLVLLPEQARAAALAALADSGDAGTVSVAGTSVTVRVQHRQPTQILGLIRLRTITTSATATADARHGVDVPEP